MIDWSSPTWGKAGQNVTFAANGSWVADKHDDGPNEEPMSGQERYA